MGWLKVGNPDWKLKSKKGLSTVQSATLVTLILSADYCHMCPITILLPPSVPPVIVSVSQNTNRTLISKNQNTNVFHPPPTRMRSNHSLSPSLSPSLSLSSKLKIESLPPLTLSAKNLSVLVLTVSLLLSLVNQSAEQIKNGRLDSSTSSFSWIRHLLYFNEEVKIDDSLLEYDFYKDSCPNAEKLVEMMMRSTYKKQPDVAPALLRLMFHDCFIQGCDASVLLDSPIAGNQSEKDTVPNQTLKGFDVIDKIKSKVEEECPATVSCADILVLAAREGILLGCDASVLLDSTSEFQSEKDTPPNHTLKGFHIIETIKSKLEEVCPATVSCADILVLSAREGVALAGGPYYPLPTGRRDSFVSFPEVASYELPSPHDDLSKTLTSFASRGFDERETVSLLGAHNIGKIHCRFFRNRLYNFQGTGLPDPSLDAGYLNLMRSRCNNSKSHSEEPGMNMGYEEKTGPGFGTHYYKTLMQGKGILHADQQLMAGEGTASWVEAYASERSLFRRDFAQVMMKLSSPDKITGTDQAQLL